MDKNCTNNKAEGSFYIFASGKVWTRLGGWEGLVVFLPFSKLVQTFTEGNKLSPEPTRPPSPT